MDTAALKALLDLPLWVAFDQGHDLDKRSNRMDAYPAAFDFLDRILAR